MPLRDLILANGTDLFEETNSKPTNISPSWMTDTFMTGNPKSAVGRVIQEEEEIWEDLVLLEEQHGAWRNRKNAEKDQDV